MAETRSYRHMNDIETSDFSLVSPIKRQLDEKLADIHSTIGAPTNSILNESTQTSSYYDEEDLESYTHTSAINDSNTASIDYYPSRQKPRIVTPRAPRQSARRRHNSRPPPDDTKRPSNSDDDGDIYPASASSIIAAGLSSANTQYAPSELSAASHIASDVLVVTSDEHEFWHSSLLLSYASPVFAQHWKALHNGGYRIDLPNSDASEWTLLQGFLEPPGKHSPVKVEKHRFHELLPWFRLLEFDRWIEEVDKIILDLCHRVDIASLCVQVLFLTYLCPELEMTKQLALRKTERLLLGSQQIDERDLHTLMGLLIDSSEIRCHLWRSIVLVLPDDLDVYNNQQNLVENELFFYLYRQGLVVHKASMQKAQEEESLIVSNESKPLITWKEWYHESTRFADPIDCRDWFDLISSEMKNPRLMVSSHYDPARRTFEC